VGFKFEGVILKGPSPEMLASVCHWGKKEKTGIEILLSVQHGDLCQDLTSKNISEELPFYNFTGNSKPNGKSYSAELQVEVPSTGITTHGFHSTLLE
jgi:hypothetical protein